MKRTNKLLRGIFVFMMLAVTSLATLATEATARVQNYDRWKDLPSPTLLDMGNAYWRVDKTDSALVCFVILSNRYNEKMTTNEQGICCEATLRVAKLYMHYFCDYQSSYRYLLKAEKIARDHHFLTLSSDIGESMAILQANRIEIENNYSYRPELLEQFKKSFHHAVKSHNHLSACFSFYNLAYAAMKYRHVKEIGDELQTFQALEIPNSIPFKPFIQKVCEGVVAFNEGKKAEALSTFAQLGDLLPKDENPKATARIRTLAYVLNYVALLSVNRDADALKELDNAERNENAHQLYDAIAELLRIRQEYYATHGNTSLAKEYELKYFKAKDEFINRSKLLSVEQQQFLFELEEMGEEVKDLQAQKRVRDVIIFGIALLALLVIGALVFLWRNYQSTKHRNLLLFQKNQELLALEAQEKERRAQQGEAKKYRSSPMDDPAKAELLQLLYDIMESHPEIYDDGFTLDQLAGLAGANSNYVSQVINEKTGSNFNAFVNEYRIKEACRRLSNTDQYGGLTIEAIGQSLGFRSRANFAATFKKFTGMTPTAYQHLVKDKRRPQADGAEGKKKSTRTTETTHE